MKRGGKQMPSRKDREKERARNMLSRMVPLELWLPYQEVGVLGDPETVYRNIVDQLNRIKEYGLESEITVITRSEVPSGKE